MHAILLKEFGPAENLRYEHVADPEPGAGQVRIAVKAAGVHLIDTIIRSGIEEKLPMPLPALPQVQGREVAGRVVGLGPGVDSGWLGKRVVAHLGLTSGGYAELAVSDIDRLHTLNGLSDEHAVAMIGTGRTAVGVLREAALTPEDVVLITAAAGGLGTLFIQAARNAGAFAIGAAGGEAKIEQVTALGAHLAVDYSKPGWAENVRKALGDREITVVMDGVGGEHGREALELLGLGGRLILFGGSSGETTEVTTEDIASRGLTVTWAIGPRMLRRPGSLRELEEEALAAATESRLVPLVGQRFPLREAAAAHKAIEARATTGKTVLVP